MTALPTPPSSPPWRILIVDDAPVSRRQVRTALEGANMLVTEAADGSEALWRARSQPFDLVLTDIHMPTMDGLDLIRQLRKTPGYEHIPICVLSSDCSRERLKEGKLAGVSSWLIKPASMPMVVETVRVALTRR